MDDPNVWINTEKIPTNEEMKKEIKEKQKEINDKKQQGTHEPNKNFHATRKRRRRSFHANYKSKNTHAAFLLPLLYNIT